jgi:predicted nucleic acid-binding protein
MILVDTSVWIDYLRDVDNDEVAWFKDVLDHGYESTQQDAQAQES